ncbi:MAG: type II secretion system F family protein [Clostridiaceae bacterium]
MKYLIFFMFIFVFMFCLSILYKIFIREKPIDKLKKIEMDNKLIKNNKTIRDKLNDENEFKFISKLSKLIPNLGINKKKIEKIEKDLVLADIPLTYEELLIIKIFLSSSLSFLLFAIFKNVVLLIISFIVFWNVSSIYIGMKKKEKTKLFESQLNEGIMIISNSLKAGYSFLQAVSVVCEETKDPFSKEFKRLLKEMRLGIAEKEALLNLLSRVESENLKLVINAIVIQKDTGGNLAEILDNIGETIRDRDKIKGELKTLTAQGKLSGTIVMLMPIFLGIIIYLFNKEYVLLLFNTKLGLIMVSMTLVSEILGYIIIRKIVNIDM